MILRQFLCSVLLAFGLQVSAGGAEVLVAKVDGVIGPITVKFMIEAIDRAEQQKAECVVFELDTPGGLDDSMRVIIKRIMSAKLPVVVFVAPPGSRAASAGAFITMASHVAAMSPGTAIGAAHPVAIGQSLQTDTNMAAKAVNDAAAYIRSIAEKRGRNIDWANSAVKESVSLSETEALAKKVIDLVAPSTEALMTLLDGRTVKLNETTVTLKTKGAVLTRFEMNWRDELLHAIANPNLAYILLMLGLMGLYFELSNPGAILPGVVGAISLILAFFAFQTLSVNYAGILLIVLAVVLFIVDIKAATHGVLTVGGLVAMVIGSLMLFNHNPDPAMRVSLQVIIPVVLITGAFFALGVWLSLKAMLRRPVSGVEGLVGQEGNARTVITRDGGTAFVTGAHWNAVADTEIPAGRRVKVVAIKQMTLKVEEACRPEDDAR
ncbi:MAG: nodulation protein NfeD [Verrucomicrobia bacterium]|nr:nodulation protein NfeD [Verrucomicrobiota bacterium]MBU1735249.1 nodulation protein NfeD [Verrucomicrobiota bacterium]MBU1857613.1 nodulation protein NfeD [Verrucomicrobiota bacterium]